MSKKLEIPWVLGSKDISDENFMATSRAADKHGKHLSKAESDLSIAIDLAATLRGFLTSENTDDGIIDESLTADTVVQLIENRIRKARDRLESHRGRHSNLFTAYLDLKAEGAK